MARARQEADRQAKGAPPTQPDRASQTRETLRRTAETLARLAQSAQRMGERQRSRRLSELAARATKHADELATRARLPAPATPIRAGRDVRVLLADDHELTREAMRSVLAASAELAVVGEATDGHEAVRLTRSLQPDLVLMDVRMPGMDGLEATRRILAEHPATRVVMLTSLEQRQVVFDALSAGAAGYLLKGASKQEVLAVLQAVIGGERRVQASLAAHPLQAESGGAHNVLSAREVEILALMAQGLTNVAIGQALYLSVNTVKSHVQHILQKLDAPDRASAVTRAAALGMLTWTTPHSPS